MKNIFYILIGFIIAGGLFWGGKDYLFAPNTGQQGNISIQTDNTNTGDDWFERPFGPDDTLGALNYLTPEKAKQAAALVTKGKVYEMGMITGRNTPAYPPRKYNIVVHQLGDGTGHPLGSNQAVSNDDTVMTAIGIGSQIDGLGHFGRAHKYYNGFAAAEVVTPAGLTKFGIENLKGIVTRGVLLDMTKIFGQDPLPAGTAYTEEHIKQAEATQGVTIEQGDVVILHSGFLQATKEATELIPGEPGLGVSGAHYLAKKGVVAIGADSWALEALPGENPQELFPVHQILLTKYGVYILENMVTENLVADEVNEFMFTLGVPRLEGAVQGIINPLAIR